ncbi:hypothetical protein QOZ80_1BG0054350 [Eleusine coracana subsp. coracana]|nr:hypothetical protein QOZ80_1BG0054350 [Eleusine coracana subsp. coracana]
MMETSHSHVRYVSNNDSSSQEDEAGDKLSELPDDILVDIVGRLDLRTTVRAGAASRRWRHIPRLLPDLKIDVYELRPARPSPQSVDLALTAYAAATSWLLAPSTRRTIRTLVLSFYLIDPHLQTIGRAVEDVAERGGLEFLQFTMWTRPGSGDLDRDGESVGRLFMSFFDTYPTAFKCLTSLELEKIRFSESDISVLLNTCSKLRYLSLTECDSGPASHVKIDAPDSEICILKLQACGYRTVELVNVPKLAALYFTMYQSFVLRGK